MLLLSLLVLFSFAQEISVDKNSLIAHVKTLSKQEEPRNYRNIAGLEAAAHYIQTQMSSYGCSVVESPFEVKIRTEPERISERDFNSENDSTTEVYKNLYARIGPEDAPVIIIGAHYDVYGNLPGADDNASGVAGLLEIARILKQHESQLTYQVELVFFTLEEPPHFGTMNMGSAVHATYHSIKKTPIELMICLEMIGFFTDEKIQDYPLKILHLFYPKRGDFIIAVTNLKSRKQGNRIQRVFQKESSLNCRTLTAPASVPGIDFSDHRNFWAHDYPALMITNTAMYRNKNYHTTHDTWFRLDYDRMSEVVRMMALFLLRYK